MGFPDLDKVLVVDIEATCWEAAPPDGEESDIIEVGLAVLDVQSLEVAGKRSILVQPERSTVSPFCTHLTGLTQEDADSGVTLAAACRILSEEYESRARVWASYGDYDREMFSTACRDLDVEYPFSQAHLNVKILLSLVLGLEHTFGLSDAAKMLGLSFEGTPHRGVDDAWNIARVFGWILRRSRGADQDPRPIEQDPAVSPAASLESAPKAEPKPD